MDTHNQKPRLKASSSSKHSALLNNITMQSHYTTKWKTNTHTIRDTHLLALKEPRGAEYLLTYGWKILSPKEHLDANVTDSASTQRRKIMEKVKLTQNHSIWSIVGEFQVAATPKMTKQKQRRVGTSRWHHSDVLGDAWGSWSPAASELKTSDIWTRIKKKFINSERELDTTPTVLKRKTRLLKLYQCGNTANVRSHVYGFLLRPNVWNLEVQTQLPLISQKLMRSCWPRAPNLREGGESGNLWQLLELKVNRHVQSQRSCQLLDVLVIPNRTSSTCPLQPNQTR